MKKKYCHKFKLKNQKQLKWIKEKCLKANKDIFIAQFMEKMKKEYVNRLKISR